MPAKFPTDVPKMRTVQESEWSAIGSTPTFSPQAFKLYVPGNEQALYFDRGYIYTFRDGFWFRTHPDLGRTR